MNQTIAYLPGLSPVENQELCARFDGGRLSSDGGVLLLRGIERRPGIAEMLASCVSDARDPASTTHSDADMMLARMGLIMINLFCASFKRLPERIVLDIDDTDDTVHGGQQLALFNAHYDDYCFQPLHVFETATGKPVLSLLRPGKRAPPERRRPGSYAMSSAASGTTGHGSGSPCVAVAITPRPRSWICSKTGAAATSSGFPAMPA